jgi:hypothetical protein
MAGKSKKFINSILDSLKIEKSTTNSKKTANIFHILKLGMDYLKSHPSKDLEYKKNRRKMVNKNRIK